MELNELKLNNQESSLSQGDFSDTPKGKEFKSIDSIKQDIKDIEADETLSSEEKIRKTESLLSSLKAQEALWQELSDEEKEAYKSLNPEERKEYLSLNSEERDFYLNHPELRDRLLEKEIKLFKMMIGSKTKEEMEKELEERHKIEDYNNPDHIEFYNDAKKLLNHQDFKVSPEKNEL